MQKLIFFNGFCQFFSLSVRYFFFLLGFLIERVNLRDKILCGKLWRQISQKIAIFFLAVLIRRDGSNFLCWFLTWFMIKCDFGHFHWIILQKIFFSSNLVTFFGGFQKEFNDKSQNNRKIKKTQTKLWSTHPENRQLIFI